MRHALDRADLMAEGFTVVNSYGRFYVIRRGWRYHVRQRGDDWLYRWVGPKPMWSRLQVERIAQALNIARNEAWDLGKRDERERRAIGASPALLREG